MSVNKDEVSAFITTFGMEPEPLVQLLQLPVQ